MHLVELPHTYVPMYRRLVTMYSLFSRLQVIVLADVITSKDPIEVIVSPYELNHVTSYLEATSIPYNVTSKDLQR